MSFIKFKFVTSMRKENSLIVRNNLPSHIHGVSFSWIRVQLAILPSFYVQFSIEFGKLNTYPNKRKPCILSYIQAENLLNLHLDVCMYLISLRKFVKMSV